MLSAETTREQSLSINSLEPRPTLLIFAGSTPARTK
jgi:hypothetical protein